MEEYKKKAVKSANIWLLAFAVILVSYYAFSAYMLYVSSAAGGRIYNLGTLINLLMVLFIYLYFKTLSAPFDKRLKLRLIPLSFVPFASFYLIGSVVTNLICAFPLVRLVPASVEEKTLFVNASAAAVSMIISAAVALPLQKMLTFKYIDVFYPVSNIVFPKQFGIRRKWYFGILAGIIVSAAFSVLTTVTAFVGNVSVKTALTGIIGVAQVAMLALVTYLLFNAAFNNIEKSYRFLFYPFMTVDYIVGKISSAIFLPFNYITNVSSFNYSDIDSVLAFLPKLFILLVINVADVALSVFVMIKLLGEFEEK